MKHNLISFWDYAEIENDKILVSSSFFNSLCEIDINARIAKHIAYFEKYPKLERNLHKKVIVSEDKIYFFPVNNRYDKIDCWNSKSKEMTQITLPNRNENASKRFYEYERIGDIVWIVSRDISVPILGFHLENETFEIKDNWNRKLLTYVQDYKCPFILSISSNKSSLFFPIRNTSTIIEINTKTQKIIILQLDNENIRLELLAHWREDIWFFTCLEENSVFRWERNDNKIEQLIKAGYCPERKENCKSVKRSYYNIVCLEERVFFLPFYGERICYVKKESDKLISFGFPIKDICPLLEKQGGSIWGVGACKLWENKILLCPGDTGMMMIINLENLKITTYNFDLEKNFYSEELGYCFQQELLKDDYILSEHNGPVILDTLLVALTKEKCLRGTQSNIMPSGKQIFTYIKKSM